MYVWSEKQQTEEEEGNQPVILVSTCKGFDSIEINGLFFAPLFFLSAYKVTLVNKNLFILAGS